MSFIVTPIPGTPPALRAKILDEDFVPYVKDVFAKDPKLRSAMLTVAQYWADEADDAVHATVLFSQRSTPIWPHPCRWDDDDREGPSFDPTEVCSSCGERLGWMPFDDNGGAIPAFQSCCREDASQESTTSEAYLPYAVARRADDGGVSVEIVGGPVRGWLDTAEEGTPPAPAPPRHDAQTEALLAHVYDARDDDGPRQVLADHLQHHGDPRGEYVALALAAHAPSRRGEIDARARELLARHARAWLGPIADVAALERVVFDRGFVRGVAVHLADAAVAERVLAAPEWGTVEELRFLPQSVQALSRAMRSLRDVGPLDAAGLEALLATGRSLPIERAHVVLADDAMARRLDALDLPSLRALVVGTTRSGPGTTMRRMRNPFTGQEMDVPMDSPSAADLSPSVLAPLLRARAFARLEELVLVSVAPSTVSAWLSRPADARPRSIAFTGASPTFEPAGFRVCVREGVASIDMPSFGEVDVDALAGVLRALPSGVRAVMRATRWYEPTPADAEFVARAAARPVDLAS